MYSQKLERIFKTKKISIGDMVSIRTGSHELRGILMPKHEFGDTNSIVIKRSDGYNVGLVFAPGMTISKVKGARPIIKKQKMAVPFDADKPTISILHTGGTIASRVDYTTGGVFSSFTPEDILEMYPELNEFGNLRSRLLMNIFSENMRFSHYREIARAVVEEIKKGSDGIIITHGTDTMHYTSSALAFMFGEVPVPVILVGAQRSSDRGSSDAFLNLISSARVIAETDFSGVAICMHGSSSDDSCLLLPPCRTRKMHSSRRDAFKTIDANPIARIGEKIEFLSKYEKKDKNRKISPKTRMEEKVGIIKIHPNISPAILAPFKNYRGIVLEGMGLGHAPAEHGNEKFFDAVKNVAAKAIVVMTTQTLFGPVNMNVYSTGRMYIQAGVIPCSMLPETALIKLSWLLGNYPDRRKDEIKSMLLTNMYGELLETSV